MVKTLLAALGLAALCAATAVAATPTRVVLYRIADPSGTLRPGYAVAARAHGYCWTASIAAQRPDAWRCMTGNEIHDPCFAPSPATHVVYCPEPPGSKRLLAIALTKPFPPGAANPPMTGTLGMPTAIVLRRGATCNFITGTSSIIAGKRMNYECTDGRDLFGDVVRRGRVWRILAGPENGSTSPVLVDIATAYF